MTSPSTPEPTGQTAHLLGDATLADVAAYIRSHDVRKILVLLGAGVSVAAGIPDFRSPNTGLYAQLQKYQLDDPTDAFSIHILRRDPAVFYSIAREMNLWPGSFKPTAVHHFVELLAEEGRLLRCCTQNIDGLEREAGVPDDLIVEAHGSFATASCIECHEPFEITRNKEEAFQGLVSRCAVCGGVVKPDVVFFGESLPEKFFDVMFSDTQEAEMVIIIGTSLQVHPFAALPLKVSPAVPRVVINMERVGGRMFSFPTDPPGLFNASSTSSDHSHSPSPARDTDGSQPYTHDAQDVPSPTSSSTTSSSSDGYQQYDDDYSLHPPVGRDAFFPGDCQRTVTELATLLGLGTKLEDAVANDTN